MIIRRCPKCRSTKISEAAGAITGQYHCPVCMYYGPIILEEDTSRDKETTR